VIAAPIFYAYLKVELKTRKSDLTARRRPPALRRKAYPYIGGTSPSLPTWMALLVRLPSPPWSR